MTPVKVGVLDHGMGNLRSVAKALEAVGATVAVSADEGVLEQQDALCVPGQGIFGRCVDELVATGLESFVRAWITDERPYLGICLGMQVLFEQSAEGGQVAGLGVLQGRVVKLQGSVVVPHIGWNTVGDTYYYFDHSYVVVPDDPSIVAGWTEHGSRFAATIDTGPILGVQFHPEKSGRAGLSLLRRWTADAAHRRARQESA
ncbi:MAG: imidazole glycerol-phosphate synthase subunit HisH [Actinomycetota bacterium]|nr:imidazole glycerol-phosphate synthase subunit HisH [Actinomycetota bacterium]